MRFAHLLSRVTGTPWLITQDALENITALLESRIEGVALVPAVGAQASDPAVVGNGAAVIPIRGVIGKRLSAMETMCGATDVDAIERAFDAANNDPEVQRIVLHVDSPGGTVTGVPELAAKMYREKRKPLMAVTDTLMASAAYYLASAADEIVATPTANVGSIGVVLQVREAAPTADGDKTRLRVFRSGEDKAIGADGPITDEQAKAYQARVDFLGNKFRSDVQKTRSRVTAESMTGWTYFGEEARTRGLVDRVVRNLAEAIG